MKELDELSIQSYKLCREYTSLNKFYRKSDKILKNLVIFIIVQWSRKYIPESYKIGNVQM